MKKATLFKMLGFVCLSLVALALPLNLSAKGRITIKTNKNVGETIKVKISSNSVVTVTGATGNYQNGSTVSYQLTDKTVTFEGDITAFENQSSKIYELTLSQTDALKDLVVWVNELTQLDLSACPNLTYVNFMSNKIQNLNFSNNPKLTAINCAQNQLTSLNIQSCKDLITIDCGGNKLTALDITKNPKIAILNCSFNKLTALNVKNQLELQNLNCSGNQIGALDLSKNTQLQLLVCFLNNIPNLDFTNNEELIITDCGLNPMKAINLKPIKKIEILDVSGCQIESLDLSENRELKRLTCHDNKLTSLFVGYNKKIRRITCYGNQIKGEHMTNLMKSLRSLNNEAIDPRQGEGEVVAVNTQNPNEGNVCSKADVYFAYDQDWIVKDLNGKHANRVDYIGVDDGTPISDRISFAHARTIGGKIQMNIRAEGPVTIKGVTGTWENGKDITYTVDMPRIVVIGKVKSLECSQMDLTSIDVTTCPTLVSLDISLNKIATLDLSKSTALQELKCEYNPIKELNFSNSPNLQKVYAYATQLSSILVDKCPELNLLSINDCKLSSINIANNRKLSRFSCSGNPLKALDFSNNPELEVVWCAKTELNKLDLTMLPKLRQVLCQYNYLTSIDLSKNPELTLFWGSNNNFPTLNFSKNTKLLEAFFYDNKIGAQEMKSLIASLPNRQAGENASIIVFNKNSATDKNICTEDEVKNAKAKNYMVYAALNSDATQKEEYPGYNSSEMINEHTVSIYSNPASEYLTISYASPYTSVRLVDASGKTWIKTETTTTGDLQLNVENIPSGNYLVVVGEQAHRIIIAH